MSYTPSNGIDKVNVILDVLAKKQQVIGANLANVDTPGYVRQDINFEQYIGSLNSPLETKMSKQMGPAPIMTSQGETVDTAQEMVQMQQVAIYYSMAIRQMSSKISELKQVTQVGR
jgi:flagellar basal-body rod protein FlgB